MLTVHQNLQIQSLSSDIPRPRAIAVLHRSRLSICRRRGVSLSLGRRRRLQLITVPRKVPLSTTTKAHRLCRFPRSPTVPVPPLAEFRSVTPCWVAATVRLRHLYCFPAISAPAAPAAATARADTVGQPSGLSVHPPPVDPRRLVLPHAPACSICWSPFSLLLPCVAPFVAQSLN